MRKLLSLTFASLLLPSLALAQPPIKIGDTVVTSSLRSRMYSWDWFGDAPNGEYTYSGSLLRFGLTESKSKFDWQVEFAVPALVNMPSTAVLPAPLGQLGLGASYVAANGGTTSTLSVFLKQGTFRVKGLGGIAGQSVKAGRMEFSDGAETTPTHGTLFTTFTKIVVPATLPYMFTGFRLSLGIAWLVIVASEMLTGTPGVGGFLWQEYNSLIYAHILLAILTIGVVGFVLDRLMGLAEKRLALGNSTIGRQQSVP